MMDLSAHAGKAIGIVGLGKTGRAAAEALRNAGSDVRVWDDNPQLLDEMTARGFAPLDLTAARPEAILWSPGIPHRGEQAHALAVQAARMDVPLVSDVGMFAEAVKRDIVAVTGTNGKSTTTALIAHALSAFRPSMPGGNIGDPVLTLPVLPEDGVYVLELSSYQLDLIQDFRPRVAVLLNVTPDHLARHGGMEGYIEAKEKIFACPDGIAVVGVDTDPSRAIADRLEAQGRRVVRVSTRDRQADAVHVENGKLFERGIEIGDLDRIGALKGGHNQENIACAYAAIRHGYGYDGASILDAMTGFPGLAHRQHKLRNLNGIAYVNDSKATNAGAAAYALAAFRNIYWILGGQAKEGGLSGLENYMDRIRHAYLIGEAAESFAAWLLVSDVPHTMCGTLENAVAAAHADAQAMRGAPGGAGTVLLSPACASWDQFRSFEHRGDAFADIVSALPENTGEGMP